VADDPRGLDERAAALARSIEALLLDMLAESTRWVNKETLARQYALRILAECDRRS
jgi:hypothetical protein